jgi:hypothetical protein
MYQVLLNETYRHDQLVSLIGDYYSPMDLLVNESKRSSLHQLADRIFMQSIYFVPIVHYSRIMGRHNLMIVSMDTFNSTIQMTSRKLEKISQTIYSFSDLCSHSIDPRLLSEISVHGGMVRVNETLRFLISRPLLSSLSLTSVAISQNSKIALQVDRELVK